jgi:acyl-CoA thioester hydrolase
MQAAFTHEVRVYWEDTDAGGVVYYANVLKFFERARTEWLRAAGIGQQQLRDTLGVIFMVTQAEVRYAAPARLDDLLRVTVQPEPARGASMVLAQSAWRGAQAIAHGRIGIACVDAVSLRPRRIPTPVLERLTTPTPA